MRLGRGHVSAIVAAFAQLRAADRNRPLIHLPAVGQSLTADDVWCAQGAYAERLRAGALRPGHLILLATGNRAATVGLFLAARSLGLAVIPVDAGTTAAEVADLSERFGAAAIVVGSIAGVGLDGDRTPLADGLDLIVRDCSRPGAYEDTALLKLTSGSTGLPKATRTTEAQLIVDSRQIVQRDGNRDQRTRRLRSSRCRMPTALSVILVAAAAAGNGDGAARVVRAAPTAR